MPDAFAAVGRVAAEAFAGTSGPLYGAFLIAGGAALPRAATAATAADFASAFDGACAAVAALGGAAAGDRTMLDALLPAASALRAAVATGAVSAVDALDAVVRAAADGAAAAALLPARKGRSRYVAGREVGLPDPGCELAVDWLRAVAEEVRAVGE